LYPVPLATHLERFDGMFPEIVRRFMGPMQLDVDLPGEIRVGVTEDDKEYL